MSRYARFGAILDRCESPIERLFLVGLLFLGETTFEPVDERRAPEVAVDSTGVLLSVQVPCGQYRIDATLTRPGASQRFAIELDGHAYHGATPAQFERDSARQRAITAKGWTVLRFAGREVVRDPRRCAQEAMRAVAALVDEPEVPSAAPVRIATVAEDRVRRVAEADSRGDWNECTRLMREAQNEARLRNGLPLLPPLGPVG